jgi:hypothetical protein
MGNAPAKVSYFQTDPLPTPCIFRLLERLRFSRGAIGAIGAMRRDRRDAARSARSAGWGTMRGGGMMTSR